MPVWVGLGRLNRHSIFPFALLDEVVSPYTLSISLSFSTTRRVTLVQNAEQLKDFRGHGKYPSIPQKHFLASVEKKLAELETVCFQQPTSSRNFLGIFLPFSQDFQQQKRLN
jgi:hypothetical protein